MGQEAEGADAHKTLGQHVQEEAAQELGGGERHLLLLRAVGVTRNVTFRADANNLARNDVIGN